MSITKIGYVGQYGKVNTVMTMNSPLLADLNGDGYLDYVFTTTDVGSGVGEPVKLFLSDSNGNLHDQSNLVPSSFGSLWTQKILTADFDHNGKLDLLLSQAPEQGNSRDGNGIGNNTDNHLNWGCPQYVLMQNSDGTFTPKKIVDGIYEAHYAETADFNEDGFQDILFISDINGSGQLPKLLLNNQQGGFSEISLSTVIDSGFLGFYGAVGDFNNDEHLDIAFLEGSCNFVALGDGQGGFTKGSVFPKIPVSYGGDNTTIEGSAVLDINSDDYSDVIAWVTDRSNLNTGDLSPFHLLVWTNNGNGTFTDASKAWLGEFGTTGTVGGDTRSLAPYLEGTKLIPLNVFLPVVGSSQDGYIQEPMFLYNDGNSLQPVFDPYWNSQLTVDPSLMNQSALNWVHGYNAYCLSWAPEKGQLTTIYKDNNGYLVKAELDPTDASNYITTPQPFTIINKNDLNTKLDIGFAFTLASYNDWLGDPERVSHATRELVLNAPSNTVLIGNKTNDYMSAGNAYAGTQNNAIVGGGGSDTLKGGSGDNFFYNLNEGINYIDGRDGTDTFAYSLPSNLFRITPNSDGTVTVSGNNNNDLMKNIEYIRFIDATFDIKNSSFTANPIQNEIVIVDGKSPLSTASQICFGDNQINTAWINQNHTAFSISQSNTLFQATSLSNASIKYVFDYIERLHFSDINLALDITGTSGQAYRIYKAAFDRAPDAGGLGFWIDAMDEGASLTNVAAGFISSPEFQKLYGANVSDRDFLTKLYNNVLDRNPDQGGYDFWLGALENGTTREDILVNFSESKENIANVADLIANGIQYQEWLG